MAKIFSSLTELIGSTPLLEVKNIEKALGLKARVLVKIEAFNPGGSVKDRAALYMIETAERDGILAPGATIIEPTSGNTGIGLAWIGRLKGYRVILTMPDTMSVERRKLLAAMGADLVLTPGAQGMKGAIAKAEELRDATPGAVILQQFANPANPAAHEATTAREIWNDTDGLVNIFVAGVGTGGTVAGTGRALKALNPAIEVVAVEPEESQVLAGGSHSPHRIQGIGAGFVPVNYDPAVVNKVMAVNSDQAVEGARMLATHEGLLAGFSSGAALMAAVKLASQPENEDKIIVALLPDTGDRYLSTTLFE